MFSSVFEKLLKILNTFNNLWPSGYNKKPYNNTKFSLVDLNKKKLGIRQGNKSRQKIFKKKNRNKIKFTPTRHIRSMRSSKI